jgi:hypothetical protein
MYGTIRYVPLEQTLYYIAAWDQDLLEPFFTHDSTVWIGLFEDWRRGSCKIE